MIAGSAIFRISNLLPFAALGLRSRRIVPRTLRGREGPKEDA
jgi:hypothetical protein